MSVNCDDFLCFANDVLKNSSTEIEFRNILSRAYYASYHRLKPLLNNAPNGHSALMDYLCNANQNYDEDLDHKTLRKIGLILEQEKKKRIVADYFLNKNITRANAIESIINAEKFKKIIEDISNDDL